ncbi:MAG: hypothetical protein K9G60_16570, partial [Pseudolabrys sp.]|nr:hypothetical protein [Pseudolabrys sp.]
KRGPAPGPYGGPWGPTGGRLADRALVLMVVTFILLTPPIIRIFNVPSLVLGVPVLHVYCYGAWLAAIACGAWLATRLNSGQADTGGDAGPTERG